MEGEGDPIKGSTLTLDVGLLRPAMERIIGFVKTKNEAKAMKHLLILALKDITVSLIIGAYNGEEKLQGNSVKPSVHVRKEKC